MSVNARVIAHTEAHAGPDGAPAYRFYVQLNDSDNWRTVGGVFFERTAAVAYVASQGWGLTASPAV